MAVQAGALQLSAAAATITFVLVTGVEGLLGLGPAIFLSSASVAAMVAGRAMDRYGRIPVLMCGFVAGIGGSLLTALGLELDSAAVVVIAFLLIGVGNGTIGLTRAAGGDMYPPERRARGISYVLFGSVFGAILGPAVFMPLFAGRELDAAALIPAWLAAAGIMSLGLVLAFSVRPDPRKIAESFPQSDQLQHGHDAGQAAPLKTLLKQPGVVPALLAVFASFSVMASVMTLTGHLVVIERDLASDTVFPILAAHVVGMFGLVLVVGDLIDRIGRRPALIGGLGVVGLSVLSLIWFDSVAAIALALFGLGLGWIIAYVAGSAELVDLTRPLERGKLLGFGDLGASFLAACLALFGGFLLSRFGPSALAALTGAAALIPMLIIARGTITPGLRQVAGTLNSR
ncbi:MAG: MFS transporter [Gaiellaceae bacterium]